MHHKRDVLYRNPVDYTDRIPPDIYPYYSSSFFFLLAMAQRYIGRRLPARVKLLEPARKCTIVKTPSGNGQGIYGRCVTDWPYLFRKVDTATTPINSKRAVPAGSGEGGGVPLDSALRLVWLIREMAWAISASLTNC